MNGRERAIILGLYLASIAGYIVVVGIKYAAGQLDFDVFKGEYLAAAALLLALMIKLPPTGAEAKATAEAANGNGTTQVKEMNVASESTTVQTETPDDDRPNLSPGGAAA